MKKLLEIKSKLKKLSGREAFQYLDIEKVSNGLWLYINEGTEEYEDLTEMTFSDIFDDVQGNSEYMYFFDVGEAGFGLTSAPGITDGYYYGDDGELTEGEHTDSELYYYPDYAVTDFTEELRTKGKVFFNKA